MKPLKQPWIVLIISSLLLLPIIIVLACGPWPAAPEEFRISLFQPNIGDVSKEFNAYYFSLNRFYKAEEDESFVTAAEINQNYKEWKEELKKDFTVKDFYKAIEEYSYEIVQDSLNELKKSNSFISALTFEKDHDYFNYFKLAKSTERYNTYDSENEAWGLSASHKAVPETLIKKIQNLINNSNSNFIKQRAAYVSCRLSFYRQDTVLFKKTYAQCFINPKVRSWVNSSAKYYYIRLLEENKNKSLFYKDLIQIIDNSRDKRFICLKLITEEKKDKLITHLKTNHQIATATAAYAIRYSGYSFNEIKKVYDLDPENKFVKLLLNREINKIEDWLLTPALTEYETSASMESGMSETGETSNMFKKQNLKTDSVYALKLRNFIHEITVKKSDPGLEIMLCHLDFLLKNYKEAQATCIHVKNTTNENSEAYLQANINNIIIGVQINKGLDSTSKNNLVGLLEKLDRLESDNAKNKIPELSFLSFKDIKDALLVYLGRTALKQGHIADAALLLSGTDKPWGEFRTGDYKNAYFLLNENAKAKDFDQLIRLLKKKDKSTYEKYFFSRKTKFAGNYSSYDFYDNPHLTNFWDVNKLYDLKGTYFLNKDSLEQALKSFQEIPSKFWSDSNNVYDENLTGNPFDVSVYDPHGYKSDSGFKSNPNKSVFISKLIQLKKQLVKETNNETRAKLNYQIGNAYYSMTYHGKFWLMSKLWWSVDLGEEMDMKNTAFNHNYYGSERPLFYYKKAFELTKDSKRKAFYYLYIANCENDKKVYSKIRKKDFDEYYHERELSKDFLSETKYLKQMGGDADFYSRLIKECPLYSSFKGKI